MAESIGVFLTLLKILSALFISMLIWGIITVSVPDWHNNTGCGAHVWSLNVSWCVSYTFMAAWCILKAIQGDDLAKKFKQVKENAQKIVTKANTRNKTTDTLLSSDVESQQPTKHTASSLMNNFGVGFEASPANIVEVVMILVTAINLIWTAVLLFPPPLEAFPCIAYYTEIQVIFVTISFFLVFLIIVIVTLLFLSLCSFFELK